MKRIPFVFSRFLKWKNWKECISLIETNRCKREKKHTASKYNFTAFSLKTIVVAQNNCQLSFRGVSRCFQHTVEFNRALECYWYYMNRDERWQLEDEKHNNYREPRENYLASHVVYAFLSHLLLQIRKRAKGASLLFTWILRFVRFFKILFIGWLS